MFRVGGGPGGDLMGEDLRNRLREGGSRGAGDTKTRRDGHRAGVLLPLAIRREFFPGIVIPSPPLFFYP